MPVRVLLQGVQGAGRLGGGMLTPTGRGVTYTPNSSWSDSPVVSTRYDTTVFFTSSLKLLFIVAVSCSPGLGEVIFIF